MSNKRKQDKKGRSKGSLGSFIAVERYIMQSIAFRSLTPNARAAYLEVCFGFDGSNNGQILLSSQMLADRINRNKSTAARALQELEQLGFVECRSRGGFSCKLPHASEWRLTAHKCDLTGELASKNFMQWKPASLKRGGTREAHGGTSATDSLKTTPNYPSQWHPCNREAHIQGVSGGTCATHLNSNHAGAASHVASNVKATASAADARPLFLPPSLPTHSEQLDHGNALKPVKTIIDSNGNTIGAVFQLSPKKLAFQPLQCAA
jgi:hypothetical protein